MIRVSIIVPAYNEERTIIQLFERVRAQHIAGVTLEIVVVDDGSKDATCSRRCCV